VILRWDVPIDIGREDAAQAAARELAKPVYGAHEPPLVLRILQKVLDWVSGVLDRAVALAPGGVFGLVVIALLVAGVVALLVWRVGRPRRTAHDRRALFVGRALSAAEHRAAADEAAARGDWDQAVRHRFRAVVRSMEERDAIDERPGRTADEAAADGARVLPDVATELVSGARRFDEVVYGGRRAGPDDDAALRALDRSARHAPMRTVVGTAVGGWTAVR
jgi:hypothetical protein